MSFIKEELEKNSIEDLYLLKRSLLKCFDENTYFLKELDFEIRMITKIIENKELIKKY